MLLCSVIAVAGNVFANRVASAVARDSIRGVRNDLFAKITTLSMKQEEEATQATLISRMTSDTYNVHSVMGMMQRLGVRAPILLIGGIAVTLTLDPVLASILIVLLPFLAVVVFFVAGKGIPLYKLHQEAGDRMLDKVRESITGIRVIKALSKTDYEEEQFAQVNENVVQRESKAGIIMSLTNPAMNFLLDMGWVAIILVGAYRVNAGLTQAGKIIAFLTYFTIILNAMLSITRLFVMFSRAGSSAARIDKVLQLPTDLQQMKELYGVEDTAAVSFRNVTFSYNGRQPNLEHVSFTLPKGETLGIIGATGSGKTTLINLLMRFYEIDQGQILVLGRDVRSYPDGELKELFGTVFQNDMIFEDTIAANISLGRDLTPEQCKKAADCACIGAYIDSLEEGMGTFLSIKGSNLSGGQRQRILIARALAANPAILVLDDSSSALDYRTDARLRRNIREQYPDMTVLIVAQRVSSVMNADKILVLQDGQILAQGSHSQLLAECELYRQISRLQTQ